MKFTQIELKEVKSLGNYESRALTITAVIDEGENEAEAVNRLAKSVRWYLNKREAEIEYAKHTATLADENADEVAKAKATRYIARYDAAKAEVEG